MGKTSRTVLAAAAAAVALVASQGAARAQYYYAPQGSYASAYRPEPFYPYVVQPQANGYIVVSPQAAPRPYPYVRSNAAAKVIKRRAGKTDPALVEELRQRAEKDPVINKKIVVRDKPVVVEHRRVVDDPPVVVQRESFINENRVVTDRPRGLFRSRSEQAQAPAVVAPLLAPGGQRVIRAEAEVTILGPDRMSIRLFRKRGEPAPAPEQADD